MNKKNIMSNYAREKVTCFSIHKFKPTKKYNKKNTEEIEKVHKIRPKYIEKYKRRWNEIKCTYKVHVKNITSH